VEVSVVVRNSTSFASAPTSIIRCDRQRCKKKGGPTPRYGQRHARYLFASPAADSVVYERRKGKEESIESRSSECR
jgi:hypothetical protein